MKRPIIAITMGDPSGIGPEIIVKAFENGGVNQCCRSFVIGDPGALERAVGVCGSALGIAEIISPEDVSALQDSVIPLLPLSRLEMDDISYGAPSPAAGDAVFRYITEAAALAMRGEIGGMVTAPINKEAMNRAGHRYPGHTELLAELGGTNDYVMMLAGDTLRVSLVTIHEPLAAVPSLITRDTVLRCIRITAEGIKGLCGKNSPEIAVLALNPHSGEGGLFGKEEELEIAPAISIAKSEGMQVSGPYPADTFFHPAISEKYDAVVAMYHDQGLIPLKMLHFEDAVNVTLGLPFIRTSVDHGTAYDLAGSGKASEKSLLAAIRMAVKMTDRVR